MFYRDNPDGTRSYRCPDCGGPSHPATGNCLSPTYILCWGCSLELAKWLQSWTGKRAPKRKLQTKMTFYECATLFKQ